MNNDKPISQCPSESDVFSETDMEEESEEDPYNLSSDDSYTYHQGSDSYLRRMLGFVQSRHAYLKLLMETCPHMNDEFKKEIVYEEVFLGLKDYTDVEDIEWEIEQKYKGEYDDSLFTAMIQRLTEEGILHRKRKYGCTYYVNYLIYTCTPIF